MWPCTVLHRHLFLVVRTPEDAACAGGFDYVLLCIKALPDVYDLAAVIESVVTPQHTCILVNTTNALGIEPYLATRYPSNVILSLVSGARIQQLGQSEFEHLGSSDIWIGSTIKNSDFPVTVQMDMAEALALTLVSGDVECHVSSNIRQQQWERMIGYGVKMLVIILAVADSEDRPIAFYPLSVLLDTPNHAVMLEKPGARKMVHDLVDELMDIAHAEGCKFPNEFKAKVIEDMSQPTAHPSNMYHDYATRRPIEIEVYLGSPIKIAQMVGRKAPHCESLYVILHHMNQVNQAKAGNPSPPSTAVPGRGAPPRGNMGYRPRPPPSQGSRRGPPPTMNGQAHNGHPGQAPRPQPNGVSRRNSFDNEFQEFEHLTMYDGGDPEDGYQRSGNMSNNNSSTHLAGQPEREFPRARAPSSGDASLAYDQDQYRRENGMSRGHGGFPPRRQSRVYDESGDEEALYDSGPAQPPVNPDNIDMMSVTSRRNRRVPSAGNLRHQDPSIITTTPRGGRNSMNGPRPAISKNRTSARLVAEIPTVHDDLLGNPLMGYSSNRYGAVDRKTLADSSRNNSLSASRTGDPRDDPAFAGLSQRGGGPYPSGPSGPGRQGNPPQQSMGARPNGMSSNGFQGDPRGRIPQGYQPRGPPRSASNQMDQSFYDPVSQSVPVKGPASNTIRSTTGSASASAASADGGSGRIGSERSAHSSSSSLEKRGLAMR